MNPQLRRLIIAAIVVVLAIVFVFVFIAIAEFNESGELLRGEIEQSIDDTRQTSAPSDGVT